MRSALTALLLLASTLAVPAVSAQDGFCDAFDPPPQGPACDLADEAIGLTEDVVDRVNNIYDIVFGIVWDATEVPRCIVIRLLGGTC